jgi:hypothetical protein
VTTRFAVLALAATAVLAGCVTGERPRLGDPVPVGGQEGVPTGDAGVDLVLSRLESSARPTFTAAYEITRKLGPNTTTGLVSQEGDATSVTVGDVRFLLGAEDATCSLTDHLCEPGTLEARTSDYSVGSAFYAGGPARALRVAYDRRNGEPRPSDALIAGVDADCVTVPVGPGAEVYCATAEGPIARWDTAAVHVELTNFQPTSDPSAFVLPG